MSQLKIMLQNVKKDTLSINDYLSKVKNVVDRLASVGHIVSPQDHVETIFNGLPDEYDTFVISVNLRSENNSVEEIESLLLAQESRIEKHSKDRDLNSTSANFVTGGNSNRRHAKGGNLSFNHQTYNSQQPPYYRANHQGRNQNQQDRNSGGRFTIEIADKIGEEQIQTNHSAKYVVNLATELSTVGTDSIKISILLHPTISPPYLLCLPPPLLCVMILHGILTQEPQITLHPTPLI